jgi:gas vesicle protein
MSNKRAGVFWSGLLVGTGVGTVLGLLIAPRSGRQTRQGLKKSAEALPELAADLSSSVQLQAGRLSQSALRNWDGTLARMQTAIAAGIEASERERRTSIQQDAAENSPNSNSQPPASDRSA